MGVSMQRRHLVPLLPALFVFVCPVNPGFAFQSGGARSAPIAGAAACRYEAAAGIPSWVTSGVFRNEQLLVVDVNKRELVEISRNGVASELQAALGDYVAGSVLRLRQGAAKDGTRPIVVEHAGGRLLEIDRSLTPRRKVEMATAGLRSGELQLARLLDWIVTGDGKEVVGYADLSVGDPNKGPANWRNGFVRFPLDRPESFRLVHTSLFPGDARTSMRLTYPLMASIGSTAYVALVGANEMGLWRFGPQDPDLRPMRAFPEQLSGNGPMLPSFAAVEEFSRTMKAAEEANMPAGLFAWDNALFLLSRTIEQGQRRWYLSKIDPLKDELLWTVRVPGSAHHMMVVPGDREWAFFEKGPVVAPLIQTTHHIRFVKSAQMRSQSLKSLCN